MIEAPRPLGFLGAGPRAGAGWAIIGAPLDVTVSFRPGSRFGPSAIRSASWVLEDWSPALRQQFAGVWDAGDLEFAPGLIEPSLEFLRTTVGELSASGLRVLLLGGEHLVTLPAVEAAAARHPGLRVLQFDAHADLRDAYMGLRASHATVMRRVAEVVGPERVYQAGIRSGTAEEWRFASSTHFLADEVRLPESWRADLAAGPIYVTVDVDCADPAFAPGTGTPEPGGASARELLRAVVDLRGLDIVGADVVEVAPAYDPSGITAILAAKVVRELLLAAAVRE
jgi:agmatinase